MADITDFFTREAANEGRLTPLFLPDGTPSEHWITILGKNCDGYLHAEAELYRKHFRQRAEGVEGDTIDDELDLIVPLVGSWSFDLEFTPENVREFLRNAPQIRREIDRVASVHSNFFLKEPTGSKTTPKRSSGSGKSRKAQK